jgi:hypothetical protein
MIVQEALERWDADPMQDYVGVQIARLEAALRVIEQKMAAGDVKVVDKLVKVLVQLDRYHRNQLGLPRDPIAREDHEAAVINRLERLAASRAVVAARFARAGAAALEPPVEVETAPPAPVAAAESTERKEIALKGCIFRRFSSQRIQGVSGSGGSDSLAKRKDLGAFRKQKASERKLAEGGMTLLPLREKAMRVTRRT